MRFLVCVMVSVMVLSNCATTPEREVVVDKPQVAAKPVEIPARELSNVQRVLHMELRHYAKVRNRSLESLTPLLDSLWTRLVPLVKRSDTAAQELEYLLKHEDELAEVISLRPDSDAWGTVDYHLRAVYKAGRGKQLDPG